MSTEKLALHDDTTLPPVSKATVNKAAHVIDSSDLPRLLELWWSQDRKGRGGRPAHIPMRAVLIVWLILAMEHQPMHLTRVTQVFLERLTDETAELIGYTRDPFVHPDSIYDRARSATTRIFNLVDAEPLSNRQRRLTVSEYNTDLAWRKDNADIIERRSRRRDILHNALLEATYQMLPAKYRTNRISIGVDATRLKVHARGIGKARLADLPDHAPISSEPDAGFYVRNSKGQIPKGQEKERPRIIEYAREAEFAVLGSNGGSEDAHSVPNIVVAYGMHLPGREPVAAARRMLDSLWERGHRIDHFAGDRAYLPAGDPDVLQNPLRLHGAKLVMDYPVDELGVQQNAHGAILVEGTWYSPGMPSELINATVNFRKELEKLQSDASLSPGDRRERKRAAHSLWHARLAQRSNYRLREKGGKKTKPGQLPLYCPAAGANPLMTCAKKPNPAASKTSKLPRLPVANPPQHTPAVCAHKWSTTFNVSDSGSHGQYYEYQSTQWANHYHHLRNNVESFNDYVKDVGTFALAQAGRRRMRGSTAESILVVITIAAANLRKIRQFLEHKREQELDHEEGKPAPESRSRRQRKGPAKNRISHREMRNRGLKPGSSPKRT